MYCIGDIVGNGLTVAVPVAVKVQPFCVYVYVIVEVPTPATFGQNVFPTTPFPLHVPPSGDPFSGTQGVLSQTAIGTTVGTMLSTYTSSSTGELGQPSALVANSAQLARQRLEIHRKWLGTAAPDGSPRPTAL